MAKTGFWLRKAQGKLAGTTIYQDGNGNTVQREIVTPKNPRTEAQLIQRILMHTVMQAYSKMKSICNHSFENVTSGTKCMQTFMKRNLFFAREKVSQMQGEGVSFYDIYNFTPLGTSGLVLNQYLLSTGSLPQIFTSFSTDATGLAFIPSCKVNTYQGVIDALGLQRGDQLTFITIEGPNTVLGQNEFKYSRVILDPTNADGSQAPLSTPFIVNNAVNAPSVRNKGTEHLYFGDVTNIATTGISFRNTIDAITVLGSAVIASRKDGNDWLRSTARLNYVANVGQVYSLGECLEAAKNGISIVTENPYYLNNAGQGDSEAVEASGSEAVDPQVTSVAYDVSGDGSNPVVMVPGSTNNIQMSGEQTDTCDIIINFAPGSAGGKLRIVDEDGNPETPVITETIPNTNTYTWPWAGAQHMWHTFKLYVGTDEDNLEYANYKWGFVVSGQGADVRP